MEALYHRHDFSREYDKVLFRAVGRGSPCGVFEVFYGEKGASGSGALGGGNPHHPYCWCYCSPPLGLVFEGIAGRRFRCAAPTVIHIECLPAL